MTTSSLVAPLGRTAAERAGRYAAASFLAICADPPLGATPDMIAWCVMRTHVTPYASDDETAGILRAVLAELDRIVQ